jgi:beta-glucosidase
VAAHHLLLGHGIATAAMRGARPDLRYGITLNLGPIGPASPAPDDVDAARQADGMLNRIFLDPLLRGRYPADVTADLAPIVGMDHVRDGDLAVISAPLDFLGVNYYFRQTVRAPRPGDPVPDADHPGATVGWAGVVPVDTGRERTAMNWEIDPTGLRDILVRVGTDYRSPALYVTENGAAFQDEVTADGAVHDPRRTAYLDGHFRAAREAMAAGADLRGYFVWSFLDNFEWAEGYAKRFGIVYVDYATQARTIKDSGHWFRRVARSNAVPPR